MFIKKIWKDRGSEILLSLAIFLLALFIRIYNLNSLPIFGDEAIYVRWAQVMRAEPSLRFLPLSDGKQPLFMWTVILFQKFFSDPLIAGRMVSVTTGVGSLIGIFTLTQILFRTRRISFLAGLVYAISPFAVFFDRMALADSSLTFFGVWTLVFAVITVKKVRLDSAMLSGFSLGGALLTKSPALFFALLTPLTLILHKWPKKVKEKFRSFSVFAFLFIFTYAIGYGLFNILRLGENFHMLFLRNQDYVYSLGHILERPFDPLLPFLDRILEYFWIMGPSALAFLVVLGILLGMRNKRKETLIVLVWAFLPILAVAEYSKVMTARYIFFSVPFVFILAALSFWENRESFSKYLKALLIIFVIHALLLDWQLLTNPQAANLPRSERSGYLEEWTAGHGIKEVAEFIREEQRSNPEEKILVGTEGYFGTLPDALQAYLADTPEVTVIGVGQPIKDIPKQLLESKAFGNKTYLVVNSSRFEGSLEEDNLELLAVYAKAVKPDGHRESLLFFEVKSLTNEPDL